MNNTRWALALSVLVVVLVGGYVAIPAIQRSADQTAVRKVVTDFGTKLQNVSLLASSPELANAMEQNYASYVSPDLLSIWKSNPEKALGRMTSSPWPDRIEVASVTQNEDRTYHVEGTVVEITSEEKANGSNTPAATYPAHMTVSKVGGAWLIVALEKGAYSELPQVTTVRGLFECVPLKAGGGTKECISGIARAQSDGHIALDLSQLEDSLTANIKKGDSIEVTGTLVPITMISSDQWNQYDLDGIMQVKELKKL